MRKIIPLMALGLAAFLVVRSQLFVSSETDRLPPQSDEDVRSVLLLGAMDYFLMEEGRAPSSIQELQNHPVGKVLNVWNYVQPLQEGEEPPPGYAGWRIENGELVLFLRYRDTLLRKRATPFQEADAAAMRAHRQQFAPTSQEVGLFYICSYLWILGKDGQDSLTWFRSPYEGQPLRWSTLDDPQPVSVTRLDIANSWGPTYVCWDQNREPVNPVELVIYQEMGGNLPPALAPFVRAYEQWADQNADLLETTPEEVLSSTS